MNNLSNYITEKILINKNTVTKQYFYPETLQELKDYIDDKTIQAKHGTKSNPIDLSYIDFSKLQKNKADISFLCYENNSLRYVDASHWIFSDIDTEYDISGLFEYSGLKYIDVSYWKLSKSIIDVIGLFRSCEYLEEVVGLNTWDTRYINSITGMFSDCYQLKRIDLSGWDLSNVKKARKSFFMCSSLENIGDTSKFDFSQLKTCPGMFQGCKNLKSIKGIENWSMKSCINIKDMFNGCINLSCDLDSWNIDNTICTNYIDALNDTKIKEPHWYIS